MKVFSPEQEIFDKSLYMQGTKFPTLACPCSFFIKPRGYATAKKVMSCNMYSQILFQNLNPFHSFDELKF